MSLTAPRLVHVGNVVIDLVLNIPQLPQTGGDVLATGSLMSAGGGFNVMAAAVRQGLPAVYGGVLGTGPFADLAKQALAAEGIPAVSPPEPGRDTGFVVCMVDAAGERTFVTTPGAEATLRPRHLAALAVRPGDWVYVSGYSLLYPSNCAAIGGWIPTLPAAVQVVFDPGPLVQEMPAQALESVLHRADWVTCSAREAGLLTGVRQPEAAAALLAARTTRGNIIVRDGANGCVVVAAGGPPNRIDGFAVHAVDTNGAGDAHTGAFLAALVCGKTPTEAAVWANASAALAVTRRGPATGPSAKDVEKMVGGILKLDKRLNRLDE
ncbi:hypothetical protein JI721_03760 [Alicyclobacillus cycloheptanicus]|uniref:Sugar/nucleoside kinase (Ribokinase family) n=1 Tax=Alicyclobacillus cycloheptanicus TaxID=1457 RepID=A0ABT9XHH3_9BACL|nr:PfkB family carbohydrate kinase [Alicyclobacillus cycloheptanicus]MDQ0189761.1 sugar/nucleoside kinase (ribokinase family) [Alicyclobacillus cycloheptanicus]WDM01965.1 hypothetical protein JI721_03760 [Alicyclobacillus cycloheptanicus]